MIRRTNPLRRLRRTRHAACRLAWGSLLLASCAGLNANAAEAPAATTAVPSVRAASGSARATVDELVASARYWVHHRRDDLAVEQLRKALLILPDDPEALSGLGQIDVRTGRMADAAGLLSRLKAKSPDADGDRKSVV